MEVHLGDVVAAQRPLGELALRLQLRGGDVVDAAAVVALDELGEVAGDPGVEVIAAEVGVVARRDGLEDGVVVGEDGSGGGAAADVEDEDVAAVAQAAVVEAVGDGGGGGLVDDPDGCQAGHPGGVHGRLTWAVGEVVGDGDDGVVDLLPAAGEASLGASLQLGDHHGGHVGGVHAPRRAAGAGVHLDVSHRAPVDDLVQQVLGGSPHLRRAEPRPEEALEAGDGGGVVLGSLADEGVAVAGEGDRGGDAEPEQRRRISLVAVAGDAGVGVAEVDGDDGAQPVGHPRWPVPDGIRHHRRRRQMKTA